MSDNNVTTQKIEGIDDQFQDIALSLRKADFSRESNKKKVYSKVIKNIEKSDSMKKVNLMKKCSAAALAVIIAGGFVAQDSQAQQVFASVLNKISLGHITVVKNEKPKENSKDSKDSKTSDKYKLYDKSGKEVDRDNLKDGETYYDKDGHSFVKAEPNSAQDTLKINDIEKINNYTCFNVKIPSYIPDGYKFKQAEFYKGEDGKVKDSKYATLVFANSQSGKEFRVFERLDSEETKYEADAGSLEKIKINGVDAALSDGNIIDWASDGTLYSLIGNNLSKDEVIKVAESIK